MTNQGFVKLSRKILNWQWYGNKNVRLVFLDLMMRAAWCDETYLGVQLHRGQAAVSVHELATSNQLTDQQIRNVLNNLKATNDITTEGTPKFTIITLNNFDEFQESNKPLNEQTTNPSCKNEQASPPKTNEPTYYNNKKEIKNKEEEAPAARVVDKNFYYKNNRAPSKNSSFDVNEVVERIKARQRERYESSASSFTTDDIMNKINSDR